MNAEIPAASSCRKFGRLSEMQAGPRITDGMKKTGMRRLKTRLGLVVGLPADEITPEMVVKTGTAVTVIVTESEADVVVALAAVADAEIAVDAVVASAAVGELGDDGRSDGSLPTVKARRAASLGPQSLTARVAMRAARTAAVAVEVAAIRAARAAAGADRSEEAAARAGTAAGADRSEEVGARAGVNSAVVTTGKTWKASSPRISLRRAWRMRFGACRRVTRRRSWALTAARTATC
mmetsp:Transcript_97663/g.178551  ORF Transcript_97663/g.178551 Transcript_97663/m.178551 type:complete len:237 (+) Transcript_97663:207-917(+)